MADFPPVPAWVEAIKTVLFGVALSGWFLGSNSAVAADLILPPWSGDFSGDFRPLTLPGAPALHWTLTVGPFSEGQRVASFVADGPELRARAEIKFDSAGEGAWRLIEGSVGFKPWLDGQLTTGQVTATGDGTLKDGQVSGKLTLELRGVDLGELIRFGDAEKKYVNTAEGLVDGEVKVGLAGESALSLDGMLMLQKDTVGVVTFRPSPGLLTSYVPEQVRKLYPGIEAIEQGRTPLEAKVLRLVFHSLPDAEGRIAQLRIEGHPRDPRLIAPLELDVNISGAVESLMRKALDSRLSIGTAK